MESEYEMAYRRTYSTRRSSYSSRSRAVKREPLWVRQVHDAPASLVTPDAANLIPDSVLDPGARIGSTVMRVRGQVNIAWAGTGTGDTVGWESRVVCGILASPIEADYSNPSINPLTDHAFDWLWWEVIPWNNFNSVTYPQTQGIMCSRQFDVKAMRRMRTPRQTLNFYIVNVPIGLGATHYWCSASTLVKLS